MPYACLRCCFMILQAERLRVFYESYYRLRKGRRLETLEGEDVRPTTDRIKEAVFFDYTV